MKSNKQFILTLAQKQSNSGAIHDLCSAHYEREVKFATGAIYAVVPASYYGFEGTSHKTAEAAIRAKRKLGGYSCQIIDRDGNYYDEQDGKLYKTGGRALNTVGCKGVYIMNAPLNTYAKDNECPNCGDTKEVVYHQYIDYFSCQNCGASFETDGTILENGE